jgi:hypothetical protein
MVNTTLAYAARYTIATTAVPALIVLDEVHMRLNIAYTAIGAIPPPSLSSDRPPGDRWALLMRDLFRFDHHERPMPESDPHPPWIPPTRGVRGLMATAPDTQRRMLSKLLNYAATFLLTEGIATEDRVAHAARAHRAQRRPFALVPADAISAIFRTTRSASMALLRRTDVEGGPLLLVPEKEPYCRQRCRATRWEAPCDIIHPRTPECPPLHRTRSPADA